ncbi:hypothetical protein J2Z79_002727 [Symbiobacterium terraclitae]|uniref:Uncharacterized protein n=1 Tax=Symbiobacterium terraclitae TaxID=557451 RepID=A0ABS4JUU3_9FIRM|nr:hypothetical protein [Symbiobacterium terraclitae]MBP2019300.1 hypothetical protein [Symbiobacterium terraclitae]
MHPPNPSARAQSYTSRPPVPLWLRAVVYSQALFWGAWWAGYLWLPEGALRGSSGASVLPIDHLPPVPRTLAVIAWNLLWMLLFAAAANLVQVRRWPLGLTAVLAMWVIYGLLLGTNSFAVPLPERPSPSVALVLQRSGFMELAAYLITAIATAPIARLRQAGWLSGRTERIIPEPLSAGHRLLLALAVLLVVAGAVREVIQWCGAAGC